MLFSLLTSFSVSQSASQSVSQSASHSLFLILSISLMSLPHPAPGPRPRPRPRPCRFSSPSLPFPFSLCPPLPFHSLPPPSHLGASDDIEGLVGGTREEVLPKQGEIDAAASFSSTSRVRTLTVAVVPVKRYCPTYAHERAYARAHSHTLRRDMPAPAGGGPRHPSLFSPTPHFSLPPPPPPLPNPAAAHSNSRTRG